MTRRLTVLTVLLGLSIPVLPGCGDDELAAEKDPAAIDEKSAILKAAQSRSPVKKKVAEVELFAYSPVGKRDPFRSYLADLKETEKTSTRPVHATERFELDQYRLTGIIHGTSQPKAMVEDPEGVGHTLRVGSRIGRNGGRVTRISAKGIIVMEEFVDPIGKRMRVTTTLKLPEDPNTIHLEATYFRQQ